MNAAEKNASLRRDYQLCFKTAEGRAVLADLARYCNIGLGMPVNTDPQVVHGVECMRRVFWHIHAYIYDRPEPAKKAPELEFGDLSPFHFEAPGGPL